MCWGETSRCSLGFVPCSALHHRLTEQVQSVLGLLQDQVWHISLQPILCQVTNLAVSLCRDAFMLVWLAIAFGQYCSQTSHAVAVCSREGFLAALRLRAGHSALRHRL